MPILNSILNSGAVGVRLCAHRQTKVPLVTRPVDPVWLRHAAGAIRNVGQRLLEGPESPSDLSPPHLALPLPSSWDLATHTACQYISRNTAALYRPCGTSILSVNSRAPPPAINTHGHGERLNSRPPRAAEMLRPREAAPWAPPRRRLICVSDLMMRVDSSTGRACVGPVARGARVLADPHPFGTGLSVCNLLF